MGHNSNMEIVTDPAIVSTSMDYQQAQPSGAIPKQARKNRLSRNRGQNRSKPAARTFHNAADSQAPSHTQVPQQQQQQSLPAAVDDIGYQIRPVQRAQIATVAEELEEMQVQPDLFNFEQCMRNIELELQFPAGCQHAFSEVQTRLKIANAQYGHRKFSARPNDGVTVMRF